MRIHDPTLMVTGLCLFSALTWAPVPASADGTGDAYLEDALPPDAHLTGKEIYDRVAQNRFRSYIQEVSLFSSDRGGAEQETRLTVTWENFREKEKSDKGILSKTVVRYTHPFEVMHSGYLIINNLERPNDQFVYLASRRRIRRINLAGENLFGTDFSFEDVVPRELEDSTYRRLPDAVVQDVPVFVVEATPRFNEDSEYSRFILHIEKQHYVPIENHYWDTAGVQVKKLNAQLDSLTDFGGVWMPMRVTMRHLLHESMTRMMVKEVIPNPDLPRRTFDIRTLETH
jgi:hypothetical protein